MVTLCAVSVHYFAQNDVVVCNKWSVLLEFWQKVCIFAPVIERK